MSSPFSHHSTASPRPMSAPPGMDDGDGPDPDIPNRMMRVKVLYTFDDGNKTNCLARLPNALPIPVIPLDETTQIGVVELAVCIQAIVASSPELIAKLEHDYTVYAYDYSEYETPLVGQGMLSWVLATASPTPNAPASQSKTMITGRVCKNILGLFSSNGIKETLEVKLKLVPVPSCSKTEFLQNMATYRNPSVVMPEGFDSNAWNSFLQAIPNTSNLEALSQSGQGKATARTGRGGMEQLHDMLTPNFGGEEDGYSTHRSVHGSRNGSPTPSNMSVGPQQQGYNQSRPASRMSMHQPNEYAVDDQNFEDGPPRKRAKPMQADWHGRGSFGGNADSLRVAVSTSASIRGFRPSMIGSTSAGSDMMPRAPTPRPGEKRAGRGSRPSASNLRSESFSEQYKAPNQASDGGYSRLDSGIYSLGDDEGSDRVGSPSPDIPSSPPEYTPVEESQPPSSPGLPELPYPADSGFQSDLIIDPPPKKNLSQPPMNRHQMRKKEGRFDFEMVQPGAMKNLPKNSFPDFDPLSHKAALSSIEGYSSPSLKLNNRRQGGRASSRAAPPPPPPPPVSTNMPPPPSEAPSPGSANVLPSTEGQPFYYPPYPGNGQPFHGQHSGPSPLPLQTPTPVNTQASPPAFPTQNPGTTNVQASIPGPRQAPFQQQPPPQVPTTTAAQPEAPAPGPVASSVVLPPKGKPGSKQGQSKGRGRNSVMARSQSWTVGGSSDVESDNGATGEARQGKIRSKSYLARTQSIADQLETSVLTGDQVKYCRNCGEIKTPTWRPYWTRIYQGNGTDISITAKSGIHMIESLAKNEHGQTTSFRVYKQYSHISPLEKQDNLYEQYIFCNPCGDWIRKYSELRPAACWLDEATGTSQPPKKRRARKKKGELTSDLPTPSSEWDIQGASAQNHFPLPSLFTDPFIASEGPSPPQHQDKDKEQQASNTAVLPPMSTNIQTPNPAQASLPKKPTEPGGQWNDTSTITALQQAIQSSPARILGTHLSPIEIQDETSPKPTRRLLFPSPRKTGEFKSLSDDASQKSNTTSPAAAPTSTPTATSEQATPLAQGDIDTEQVEVDKENLPPADDDDEFAHLFDESVMPVTPGKLSPQSARSLSKLLKTPTPLRSRNGNSLTTPRSGTKRSSDHLDSPSRSSSRLKLTPNPALRTPKPMTPFTASLNQFLSDGLVSSPGKAFNWGFTSSPARGNHNTFGNSDDVFSDFTGMPSSPPLLSTSLHHHSSSGFGDLGFQMFEDNTATEALPVDWDDGFFDGMDVGHGDGGEGNAMDDDDHHGSRHERRSSAPTTASIDFAAILEGSNGIVEADPVAVTPVVDAVATT